MLGTLLLALLYEVVNFAHRLREGNVRSALCNARSGNGMHP